MLRLQGREAGPADQLWLGLSTVLPGGGTTLDASGIEKMYVVLEGEVAVSDGADLLNDAALTAHDDALACWVGP